MNNDKISELKKEISKLKADISKRKRAEEIQSVLFNISQTVSKSDSLKDLLKIIHLELSRLMDTTNFYVAFYDENNDTYTFPYEIDEEEEGESYTPLQLKKSLTDYVRRTGKPVFCDDKVHRQLTESNEVELIGVQSKIWMGAPLVKNKKAIGVVALQTYKDEAVYTESDLEILSFVADSIALNIERKRAEEELKNQLTLIQKQRAAIMELSTPVINIWDGVLVIPLIGVLDSKRAQHLTEGLLTSISSTQSKIAIIDITGVPTVDSAVANHLIKTMESVRLQGAKCVITGIRPEVAQAIVQLGIDISQLESRASLAQGLKWAFRIVGSGKGVTGG
jgi:anti-anti-sigma factor